MFIDAKGRRIASREIKVGTTVTKYRGGQYGDTELTVRTADAIKEIARRFQLVRDNLPSTVKKMRRQYSKGDRLAGATFPVEEAPRASKARDVKKGTFITSAPRQSETKGHFVEPPELVSLGEEHALLLKRMREVRKQIEELRPKG